ncbi:MAG: 3-dehydroquinate synthase [Bacteroidota bacterium]|jgi:3-dehydroquinate synthase
MKKKVFHFSGKPVNYYFDASFEALKNIVPIASSVIITDENVFEAHKKKFKGWATIVLKPGEQYKVQQTVDVVIDRLIELGADRQSTLIGVGGGVITDITGYVASIYMRGIAVGFVPTSLLAMVDASIGGKNGIDVGVYKNMVGIIRQPNFLLFDTSFLKSLPLSEWQNGFAEIIKHGAIKDATLIKQLQSNSLAKYKKDFALTAKLVERNVMIKTKVVLADEFEKADRKLLNFGHTLGHALENTYELSHGQAISIGMTYAAVIAEQLIQFKGRDTLVALLEKYGLPTYASFNIAKVISILQKDKKKTKDAVHYILLEKIGKGVIQTIPFVTLEKIFKGI